MNENCEHCENHEGLTNKVSELNGMGKVAIWVVTVFASIVFGMLVTAYASLNNKDHEIEGNQKEHERTVTGQLEKAVNEVRYFNENIEEELQKIKEEQIKIKNEQKVIKVSNERILEYLEILIEERGITLKPRTID